MNLLLLKLTGKLADYRVQETDDYSLNMIKRANNLLALCQQRRNALHPLQGIRAT